MSSTRQFFRLPTDWLLASPLAAAYVDVFTRYLSERRHASKTIRKYLSCLAHFGRWMSQCQLNIERIDEDLMRRFLDDHLPRCDCARPVLRNRVALRAALGHLLLVLRAEAVIPEAAPGVTPVDEELRRFDAYMVTRFAFERIDAGLAMPGVIEIVASASIGKAVEDLALIVACFAEGELDNQLLYMPL